MRIAGREYTRKEAERRIGNLRQLGGIRHCELFDGRARGVRAMEVTTGSGLAFTVLPDRGLDIADFSYKGVNLVYHATGGIAHPSYHDPSQSEWLRVFFGGLLTTCGLTYFGQPGRDGDEDLGLARKVFRPSGNKGERSVPLGRGRAPAGDHRHGGGSRPVRRQDAADQVGSRRQSAQRGCESRIAWRTSGQGPRR